MKIVHSFWSKPLLKNDTGDIYSKVNGGWRAQQYYYYSWALSCLKFREFYDKVELVTDEYGYDLLIKKLNLPYTSVKVELDKLNHYPDVLWAIGKLYAYSIQDEPFIHADGDVFIWKPFEKRMEEADLIAQHEEVNEQHYTYAYDLLTNQNFNLPEVLKNDYLSSQKTINASNAGIIGGKNYQFFKEYVREAFNFIASNLDKSTKNIIGSSYAILYEQYLYNCIARKQNQKIEYLFSQKEINEITLSRFINKYSEKPYVHVLSQQKRVIEYCKDLEELMKYEYPAYYENINHITNM